MIRPITGEAQQRGAAREEQSAFAERLLCRIGWPGPNSLATLGVTSCFPGEGVTTIAAGLAEEAAGCGKRRVLLADFCLNRPGLHRTLDLERSPGVCEVLAGKVEAAQCVQESGAENLFLLSAGELASHPSGTDDATAIAALVQNLKESFDLVVLDLPPVREESSTLRLAGLLDGVILVVEAERVRWEIAHQMQEQLRQTGAKLLGAVLNKCPRHVPDWLYRTL